MHKKAQQALFHDLLITYGLDFGSAYADLVEKVGEDTVDEGIAKLWHRHFSREEAKAQSAELVSRATSEDGLDLRVANFASLDRDQKLSAIDEGFVELTFTAIADRKHEIFEPRDRIAMATKGAEMLGTPLRVQTKRGGGPQAAHQAVPALSHTFGTLSDRMVLTLYIQNGMDLPRLTNAMQQMDPAAFKGLTPEYVGSRLTSWQASGVIMDAGSGAVLEWDDAVELIQHGLKTLPASES